jgi:maltose O-acetyltransferase
MKTEYEKMISGEQYDANESRLIQMRKEARAILHSYNQSPYSKSERELILKNLLGKFGSNIDIQAPFFCDYGMHIEVGDNFYANFNCVFLDCHFIKMGHNVFLGPNVQLYTPHHPVLASERIKGPELARPITIGDNVWIGGSTIICGGVNVGENTSIGAGSVLVKNIPANVLAAGNPCKVIRQL